MSILLDAQWPEGINDTISSLLESCGIPNVLWGDLAHYLYGSDQLILVRTRAISVSQSNGFRQNCGFIVPTHQIDAAVCAIEDAGLAACPAPKPNIAPGLP